MRLGDPEELADDRARQGLRQVGDDVHPAGRRDAIEQGVGVRLNTRTKRLHRTRRERPAHRVAEPRVVRRVPKEHRLPVACAIEARGVSETARRAVRGRSPTRPEVALEALASEPRVAEDRRDVRVAREDPQSVRRAVDWILGPQARVQRIRIGEERGVGRPEEGRVVDPRSVVSSFVDPRPARPVVSLKRLERRARHARSRGQLGCQRCGRAGPYAERAGVTRDYRAAPPTCRDRRFRSQSAPERQAERNRSGLGADSGGDGR